MRRVAIRNLRLCTKDCLCIYVCPVGATDTENSIIDVDKCMGCGACADACPNNAISMVPTEYPPQQKKDKSVVAALNTLSLSKARGQQIASRIAGRAELDGLHRLMKAIAKSEELMAEDLLRESGYMIPQSHNVHVLLENLIRTSPSRFPVEVAERILELIPDNDLGDRAP